MDTGLLKGFAAGARVDLIKEVGARLDVVLASGSVARAEAPGSVAALERAVGKDGREAVVDRVAYTWFNRIIALRFMDANGYTGVGVVSPEPGKLSGQPQVLWDAKGGDFDADVVSAKTQATVTALLNDTRPSTDPQGEAYGLLLEAYCRFWNKAMPFMFEREGDYTELLMPTALLATDSVRDRAVRTLTDEVCGEVEVIGWLYQFYISQRKDEVFAGFKKNKKAGAAEIPAATQLFTPHWIVRYLVENSLGRLWLLNHPESQLAEQMDYYIPPVDEETDFLRVSSPEELKIIDPAAGSGHMLTYAFDLLYAIYEEQAYSPSEIPSKILEHNLYGAEIDPRAGALAAFALTMKAAKKRKLFLKNPVQPHICVLENVRFEQADLDYLWSLTSGSVVRSDADGFWNAFEHADTFGSLIQPSEALIPVLTPVVQQLETTGNLLAIPARRVLDQAEQLSSRYHVVVANPPYMGSGNMGSQLSDFVKEEYPAEKQDLYTCFIARSYELTPPKAVIAMVVGDTWMTLSGFESFRRRLIAEGGLESCLHLDDVSNHPDIFGANTAFVLDRGSGRDIQCTFVHLEPLSSEHKRIKFAEAIQNPGSSHVFRSVASDFRDVPRAAFAYRMGGAVREVFAQFPTLATVGDAKQGLSPGDTARFVRYWFEVDQDKSSTSSTSADEARLSGRRWFPFNKGGAFRRWFGNIDHVINWADGGRDLLEFRPRSVIRNPGYFFRPGVTWSSVSSGESAFRAVDAGVIFSDVGQTIFADDQTLKSLLAVLNSHFGSELLSLLAPSLHFQAGVIAQLPISPDLDPTHAHLVDALVAVARFDWNTQETAPGFLEPDWTRRSGGRLEDVVAERAKYWAEETCRVIDMESSIDEIVQRAYGLSTDGLPLRQRSRVSLLNNPYFGNGDLGEPDALRRHSGHAVASLVSYAIGCMFGRYSLDVPGLVLANQGDSLQEYLAKVPSPSFVPDADGVIPVVDGEWFEDDVVAKFRQFLRVAFGDEHFEENLKFVIDSLGVKDLRDYFVKSFYKDHVQRYKKRPIYWMFSSPKGSFNALVYLHRYNPSTVSTVLNEYLREFIKKLEVSLEQQERMVVSGTNAREVAVAQKEAERLRKVLIELADYERDLYKLASVQINLDLDDGVLVNYQKFGAALKDIGLKKGGDSA